MTSSVAPDFWACFNRLPATVQARARKQYALWQQNHWHPSLHFKRVDDNHRALGVESDGTIIWFFIGRHDAYEARL